MVKHPLLRLQETLRVLIQAGHNKNVAAVTEPAAEDLDHLPFSTQVDSGFAPVDLNSIAGVIFQRHIYLGWNILGSYFVDHTAHNGVGTGKSYLGNQTVIDPL